MHYEHVDDASLALRYIHNICTYIHTYIHRYSAIALAGQSRKDYVIQKNAWSSSSSTSQSMNQSTSKVFYLYTSNSIYIVTNFHASVELHRGSEFLYNYIINYLIITS